MGALQGYQFPLLPCCAETSSSSVKQVTEVTLKRRDCPRSRDRHVFMISNVQTTCWLACRPALLPSEKRHCGFFFTGSFMKAFEARKRALLSCTKGAGAFLTFSPKIRLSAIVGGERSARRFGAIFRRLPEGIVSPRKPFACAVYDFTAVI
jgi:hypothetical protein